MKAYHLSFVFEQMQPGIITLPADSPEHAKERLHEMLAEFKGVKIFQVTDLEEIPFMQKMFDQQQAQMDSLQGIDDTIDNDDDVMNEDNVVEFKKPN